MASRFENIMYHSGRRALDLYARLMLDMDVVKQTPLPEGPKIFAANHPTTIDPFLITTLFQEQMHILITEMAFKAPFFGDYLRLAGHIPVVRNQGRVAFEQAISLLESGQSIAIFPEGALSPQEGGLGQPRTGAARLALITGAPVVPVGIHLDRTRIHYVATTFEDLSAVARWYLRGPYAMTAGQAACYEGAVGDRERVVSISKQIMEKIEGLMVHSAIRLRQAEIPEASLFRTPIELGSAR